MRAVAVSWAALAGAVLAGCVSQANPPRTAAAPNVNFQQIVETAKEQVYPTLVFVKPIQETFRAGERQRSEVFGSGVIISEDGYVITNNHVAEKAVQVNCVLGDKEQVSARVVGLDPETDLALLKLQLRPDQLPLRYATFADSDTAEAGQFVLALGSPFGFTRSISLGIISNTRRYIGFNTQYQYNLWLQTDAAINPGNSGGPLVNTEGKVVGINTLGASFAGGIGFAIPSNVVQEVAGRLKEKARVTDEKDWPVKVDRAYTGLQLQAMKDFNTNTFTKGYEQPSSAATAPAKTGAQEFGVLVQNVERGSPAEEAGIQAGDLLLKVADQYIQGEYVEELPTIRRLLADLPVDKPTALTIIREGDLTEIKITPVLKGKFEGEDFELRRWNFTVKEITKFSNPGLYFQQKQGVFIQGVRYSGNASDAGLRVNDIILKIGDVPIKTIEDVKKAYEKYVNDATLPEKKVLINIKRGGNQDWKTLNWTKDYLEED